MHCVYKITFTDREEKGIYPCYYIGSKSNCVLKEGGTLHQIKKDGKVIKTPYWGSSQYRGYKDIVKTEEKVMEVIKWFSEHDECLMYEKYLHEENDVVINTQYFNKVVASTYMNNAGYFVCKHAITGKVIRLHKDHDKIKDGTYVGVNKGRKKSEDELSKRKSGVDANHYGCTHSEETKLQISNCKRERINDDPLYYASLVERCRKMADIPVTEETKQFLSKIQKGRISLTNIKTGENVRLHRDSEDYKNIDKTIWKNQLQVLRETFEPFICNYCGKNVIKYGMIGYHGEKCKMKPKDNNLSSIIEE